VTPRARLRAIATGSSRWELQRQYGVEQLAAGLRDEERVVYRKNGNRAVPGRSLLKALRPALERIGVTRTANISGIGIGRFPVFQAARPNVFYHTETGQNSGGQGKGYDEVQAQLSCLMETIEGYCCEPRNADLIRASYAFLKPQHVVLDPRSLVRSLGRGRVQVDEPIMWTPAYSLALDRAILVPAACVYFPFLVRTYRTRSVFPCGSNGLASGTTYLEATTHALYELIERYYLSRVETGEATFEAIYEEELTAFRIKEIERRLGGEFELQVFAAKLPRLGRKNLPFVQCALVGDDHIFVGSGCSSEIDVSLSRAISEAFQAPAIIYSGTREDVAWRRPRKAPRGHRMEYPRFRTLRYRDYKRQVIDKPFRSLGAELRFLKRWLAQLGFPEICVANLTRAGVEVPVVKAIVPGLPMTAEVRNSGYLKVQDIVNAQFKR